MELLFVVALVLLLVAGIPRWSYSKDWGYGPSGMLGFILFWVLGKRVGPASPKHDRRSFTFDVERLRGVDRMKQLRYGPGTSLAHEQGNCFPNCGYCVDALSADSRRPHQTTR